MLKPGTIIAGKYRLCHLIAEGGIAEVYLCETLSQHQKKFFALKRLLPHHARNEVFTQLFDREAALSRTITHKNIVHCHDVVSEGSERFMVMEFIFGKEIFVLLPYIETLSISERTKIALAVGFALCEALSYVHKKTDSMGISLGIVHGDISPQNIMITADGDVKLYDFGAATMRTSRAYLDAETVRGNWRYMSFEQMSGQPIDARSDLFSLSLVMFEMVVGKTYFPVRSGTAPETFDPFSKIDAQFLSTEVEAFFRRGLARNVDKRFHDCDEMLDALTILLAQFAINDQQLLLKNLMSTAVANGVTLKTRPGRHHRENYRSLFYLSFIILGVGFLVWGIVTVGAELFEPKYQHNIPYFEEVEPAVVAVAIPEFPALKPQPKIKLESSQKKHGVLIFLVKPWAEVVIDGEYMGSTPMEGLTLPEGKYLVELRNPDLSAVALKMVKIYADKKTEVVHKF